MDEATWREGLLASRAAKDAGFLSDPHSPIPKSARAAFKGLVYYDPAPSYRVEAVLDRSAKPKLVTIEASGGDQRRYLDVGPARFRLHGQDLELRVWEPVDDAEDEPYVFIAFRDATSGTETYGGGRYFDTDPPGPDGRFTLDLNRAYHPYCSYDDTWSCVLPPVENWLRVPIRAGERM